MGRTGAFAFLAPCKFRRSHGCCDMVAGLCQSGGSVSTGVGADVARLGNLGRLHRRSTFGCSFRTAREKDTSSPSAPPVSLAAPPRLSPSQHRRDMHWRLDSSLIHADCSPRAEQPTRHTCDALFLLRPCTRQTPFASSKRTVGRCLVHGSLCGSGFWESSRYLRSVYRNHFIVCRAGMAQLLRYRTVGVC